MRVGAIDISPVLDGTSHVPVRAAYEAMPDEAWAPHQQFLSADGNIEIDLGGFLIRTADRVVLVDTGIGTVSPAGAASALGAVAFEGGRFLDSLAALGVTPDDVTDVVLTHLHFDHVGWSTQKGVVVFPHATYRCDGRDWAHFVGPDPGATRKLSPLTERLSLLDGDGPILPGVDVFSAPGHTPGSTVVVVSSGVERAVLLGDVVHCPVELVDEEWEGMADVDPALAKRTRNAWASELEGTNTPVAAAHFPGLQFGRLLAGQGQRHWVVP
jgi:glyoxylase-like metal-dependent hydrolase (beta-lactamase superfamily II)